MIKNIDAQQGNLSPTPNGLASNATSRTNSVSESITSSNTSIIKPHNARRVNKENGLMTFKQSNNSKQQISNRNGFHFSDTSIISSVVYDTRASSKELSFIKINEFKSNRAIQTDSIILNESINSLNSSRIVSSSDFNQTQIKKEVENIKLLKAQK
jgi:hypothetical protein